MDQLPSAERTGGRRLLFGFLAVIIVVAPLVLASWFALCPQYGNPACPGTAHPVDYFPAVRAAPATLLRLFFAVNLIVPYLYPLSFIGMAVVSWRTAPFATGVGMVAGWLGSIAWGFIADELFVWSQMAGAHEDALLGPLLQANAASWNVLVVGAGWVIGHLVAYVALGIAFVRTPGLPRWCGIALIVAAPLMGPLAYGLGQNALQILGFVIVAAGCLPAARILITLSPHPPPKGEGEEAET